MVSTLLLVYGITERLLDDLSLALSERFRCEIVAKNWARLVPGCQRLSSHWRCYWQMAAHR